MNPARDDVPVAAGVVGTRHPGSRGWLTAAAGLSGLVAVVCALLLPFAPVSVNEPTVSWPRDPGRPESTLLTLTAYRPLALDVRFSCDVARLASSRGSVVVSTALAGSPGMAVTAGDDRVRVRIAERVLIDDPLPAGGCSYRITGRSDGRPSDVRPPDDSEGPRDLTAFAGPGNAELVVTRDGRELARAPVEQLPDVDALVSSLTTLPPDAVGDLAVRLRPDDEFSSSPTALKSVLIAVLVLALLVTGGLLVAIDRASPRSSGRPRIPSPRVVDLVVAAVLVAWTFVAPATDDDGWFTAQARNAALSGEVGNYYQFYDQSYVPFTWVYHGLSAWQQLVGSAPVPQRVPALVLGLLTWLVLRRFAARVGCAIPAEAGRGVRAGAPVVLGVVFLAWWVPYDMGVRPEPVVALCGAAAMLTLLAAARRRRLALAWLAFVVAGLGFTAHTTGVVLLAGLVAGLPLLRSVVHAPGAPTVVAARVLAVGSGTVVASLLGFADGALRDFRRGQALFLSVEDQTGWTGELQRYAFLLDQVAMGNFAKRAAVLACLVALGWFVVLAVAAQARRIALPTPLWLAASTTALAFVALAATPSKWTHHFGALAGVGSAFLGLMLVTAVPLTRRVLGASRPPTALAVAVAASFVAAIALAWHGPNSWPYAWLAGVRTPDQPPSVGGVSLDSPVLWGLAVGLVMLTLAVWGRRKGEHTDRGRVWWAVPIVVVGSLAATTAYTVGTFSSAALRGVPPGSVWVQSVSDPTGARCGAAADVRVLDPFAARPLPATGPPPPSEGFVAGGGHGPGRPQGSVTAVWGSLVSRDRRPAEQTTGRMSTGWYRLPDGLHGGEALTLTAAGTLGEGNALTAVYGRRSGAATVTLGTTPLIDAARGPSWRTFTLRPPPGVDAVRLDAVDRSGAVGGWLAFTAPGIAPAVPLAEFLAARAPTALGWQLAFTYPCARQPAVVDGITEPPSSAVLRVGEPLSGLGGVAWQPGRGGVFGQVTRTQSVLALAMVGPVDPSIQVYALDTPLARAAYTLTTDRRTVPGAGTAVAADSLRGAWLRSR